MNAIGVDVGGTKIAAGLVTSDGELLNEHRYPTADEPEEVSATATEFRYPPSSFVATFSVGGGGSPTVPEIRTRSGPASASAIVSKRAVTSGPR